MGVVTRAQRSHRVAVTHDLIGEPREATREEILAENARLREELAWERAWRRAERRFRGNAELLLPERAVLIAAIEEIEHQKEQGIEAPDGFYPVYLAAIARRAGVSTDTVSKTLPHLAGFGLLGRKIDKDGRVFDENLERWRPNPTLYLRYEGTLFEALNRSATFAPTAEERKAVTGKTKPGGARDAKPPEVNEEAQGKQKPEETLEVLDGRCPSCGSENTSLWCLDCEEARHTSELRTLPHVAAEITKYTAAGCPDPHLCIQVDTGGGHAAG